MEDDAVFEHERAQARPIAAHVGRVGSAHGRELGDGLRERCHVQSVAAALAVVIDGPPRCCSSVNETLKLKSLPSEDAQGNVHPTRCLYACSFASGAPRHRGERDMVIGEVNDGAVKAVRESPSRTDTLPCSRART